MYGAEYCRSHLLSPGQGKVMRAITDCRTAGWVVISTLAPPAATPDPLTTPAAIVTVPSVRLLPKNDGLKTRSMICWTWCTSTWCSQFRPNYVHCFSAATEPCTICCFEQLLKRCPNFHRIRSIWELKLGSLLSCTPGVRISASIPMFIVLFRPAVLRKLCSGGTPERNSSSR